jgi:hypothetical protein
MSKSLFKLNLKQNVYFSRGFKLLTVNKAYRH